MIECFLSSFQVCAALRKMTSVLRLGVYRERIEKYSGSGSCGRRSAEELRNHAYPEDSDESGLPPYSTLKAQPQQPQKGDNHLSLILTKDGFRIDNLLIWIVLLALFLGFEDVLK